MTLPSDLQNALRRYAPEVQRIAIAARKVVLDELGRCYETIFQVYRNNVTSVLYGTTEKVMKDNICLVVVYRDHVNLMFPRGVDLDDPQRLLEGSGKAMRHVKLLSESDVAKPGVRQLLAQAKTREGLGRPATPLRKVVTRMKAKTTVRATRPALPRLF